MSKNFNWGEGMSEMTKYNVNAIVERAEENNIAFLGKMSLLMDMELAYKHFNLDLDKLLTADDFNFAHDVCGIQRHIDRENLDFLNHFLPRCSRPKKKSEEEM